MSILDDIDRLDKAIQRVGKHWPNDAKEIVGGLDCAMVWKYVDLVRGSGVRLEVAKAHQPDRQCPIKVETYVYSHGNVQSD
jgi:hypothetical protein